MIEGYGMYNFYLPELEGNKWKTTLLKSQLVDDLIRNGYVTKFEYREIEALAFSPLLDLSSKVQIIEVLTEASQSEITGIKRCGIKV